MAKRAAPYILLAALLCSCREPARHTARAVAVPVPVVAPGLAGCGPTSPTEEAKHPLQFGVLDVTALTGGGAMAINNRGDLAGNARAGAFLLSHTRIRALGHFQVFALNDHSDVAGSLSVDGKEHPCLWRHGRLRDLGTLGHEQGRATGLNNRGQVIGWVSDGRGPFHSFVLSGRRMRDLGTALRAVAINDAGQVLAASDNRLGLWRGGRFRPLPITSKQGFALLQPAAINRGEQIAYTTDNGIDGGYAWLYSRASHVKLGRLVPHASSRTYALNNRGQVVGAVVGAGGGDWGALLWQKGLAYSLDDPAEVKLSPPLPKGATLPAALAVNDRGQILVTAQLDRVITVGGAETPERRSYLLTPGR